MDERNYTPERVLALAGTAALLLVLLVIVLMLAGGGGDDDGGVAAAPVSTRTPTPTPTPSPKPTPPPLTPAQREEREAAVSLLLGQGITAVNLKTYRGDRTLRVLVGHPTGDPDRGRRAFFFVDGRQVGSDAPEYSTSIRVLRNADRRVTLRYRLYDGAKAKGTATVRFGWDGERIQALDLIPLASERKREVGPQATTQPTAQPTATATATATSTP